jgi:hypothetical protein
MVRQISNIRNGREALLIDLGKLFTFEIAELVFSYNKEL